MYIQQKKKRRVYKGFGNIWVFGHLLSGLELIPQGQEALAVVNILLVKSGYRS